jgi:ATP-binding cassette subfamily F protein 3
MQHMIRLARDVGPNAREQELRDFLGRFQFTGDMVNQPVNQFSGGEKARLVLALVVWQRPNLLLLDEPTNHLDLTTREALSMALNEFEGTVMLVSHDRALLREVCDEFWLVAKGAVSTFDGDLDDYQKYLSEVARETALAAKASRGTGRGTGLGDAQGASATAIATPEAKADTAVFNSKGKEDRKTQAAARQKLNEQLRPLKAELKKTDERMARAQEDHAKLTQSLGSISIGPSERADQGKRLKALDDEIAQLEVRWLELTEAIEKLGT